MFEADVYTPASPASVKVAGSRVPERFTGTVSAVFDRALNIRIEGDPMIVALVTRPAGLSARALLIERIPHGAQPGDVVQLVDGTMTALGGQERGEARFPMEAQAPMLCWNPAEAAVYDGRVRCETAGSGLEITIEMRHRWLHAAVTDLRAVLSDSCAGKGGFVSLLGQDPQDAFVSRAARCLAEGRGEACIGLGIGLTPSGDDFLTGALLTCEVLGAEDGALSRERIRARLNDRSATTDVSRTQLLLALDGHAPAFLRPVLEMVTDAPAEPDESVGAGTSSPTDRSAGCGAARRLSTAKRVTAAAREATTHGQSSGCDALAGVVWMLERVYAKRVRAGPGAAL